MFSFHVTERLTRLLLTLSSSVALLKGAKALKLSHVSSTGTVYFPFWIVFLCLSAIGTVAFVVGYVTVVNRRRTIIRGIFGSPEYELLEDYDSAATDCEWKNLGTTFAISRKEEVATPKFGDGLTPDTTKTKTPCSRIQDCSKSRSKEKSSKPRSKEQHSKSGNRTKEQNSKSSGNRSKEQNSKSSANRTKEQHSKSGSRLKSGASRKKTKA
ncbi:hypothetical protein Y032_0048g1639 [Ancylostoma ceylanicum]|uniref:Uncharacterized protein n=1 Tax=Ancylostoma ceylanicum TaxID=53326 RepID=A0A016UC29_9BILA|nr:hypothetical protein Y032_0048g1639 [Ancylostoma ceylanicum]